MVINANMPCFFNNATSYFLYLIMLPIGSAFSEAKAVSLSMHKYIINANIFFHLREIDDLH